ncbi:MAG: tRNA lysidine(34) synthetase TilS [Pseudomonadota bacterium]
MPVSSNQQSDPFDLKALVPRELAATTRWRIAFSGGPDSTSLLLAFARTFPLPQLAAVHVDHGVDPAAGRWAETCAASARQLGVPLEIRQVAGLGTQASEAELRAARYAAFCEVLEEGDTLVTAHHQADVAETVLLAALRGGAPHELAAIPALRKLGRGWLWRPWLAYPQSQLHGPLADSGLRMIDDPANHRERHRRSLLRQRVLPVLERGWPDAAALLAGTADRQARAARVQDELLDELLAGPAGAPRPDALPATLLTPRSSAVQVALAQRFLRRAGVSLPPERQLRELLRQRCECRPDRHPQLSWDQQVLRCWRGNLYLLPRSALAPLEETAGVTQTWLSRELPLPDGSRLRWVGPGEAPELVVHVGAPAGDAAGFPPPRRLRKLFQEQGVPPWERRHTPVLLHQAQLAQVGLNWSSRRFTAIKRDRGLTIEWVRPGT